MPKAEWEGMPEKNSVLSHTLSIRTCYSHLARAFAAILNIDHRIGQQQT